MSTQRFRIAFSFAGEKRDFVEKVAEILAKQFSRDAILYDKYHEAEFARYNLGIYLPKLYGEQSDLIVPILCKDYDTKRWTGWEWVHIYGLLTNVDGHRVMPSRFDYAQADGLSPAAGFIELDHKTPDQFATLILERLAINEGKPRDHYQLLSAPSSSVIPKSSLGIPSNLPGGYIGRLFLGRDDFLSQLRDSLQRQTHATAITQAPAATGISGLGGIGKTHTAIEYALRYRGHYTALLFASGDSPEKLSASLAALCGVLHLDPQGELPPDESARISLAVDWLATHRGWLLIVDNVDAEESAAALTGLLERLTTGHVLITSRLHGWADNVESLDIEVLSPAAATDLLLQLTDKQRRKTPDDAAQARQLAELMEGLPLALHQAAGYIKEQRLTLAAYHSIYYDEATDLLGWFKKHLIPYAGPEELGPRPVLITWKTSFDKLDEDTRFWLLVFAHFAPDPIPEFLLDSAPGAKDEVKTLLRSAKHSLAEAETYSLLTRDPDQPRFKLHRLVQHILRLTAPEADRATALVMGIQLFVENNLGSPQDVRTWKKWTPLQPHAVSLVSHASDEPAPERLSWLLNHLAQLLKTKALHAQAEPHYRRALKLEEASHGPDHPEVATSLNNLAQLLQATNRLEEAEPLMRRALGIDEASYGPDHPRVAIDLNNLAELLRVSNRLEEAEPLYRRALGIDEASYGPDHPDVATGLNNLAMLLQAKNRLAEAEPLMWRVVEIFEISYGKDHPNVATSLNNLATLLQAKNRLAEAEPLMRRAFGIFVRSLGLEHPSSQTVGGNYIVLLQALEVPEGEIEERVKSAVEGR